MGFFEDYKQSSYNLKIENYEERVTVTKYDIPIYYMSDEEREEKKNDKTSKKTAKHSESDTGCDLQGTWYNAETGKMEIMPEGFDLEKNPFTGMPMLVPKPEYAPDGYEFMTDSELKEYVAMMIEDERDKKQIEYKLRNTRRTKQTVYELTKANRWELFVTLTIANEEVRNSLELAKQRVHETIQNLQKRKGLKFKYVLIPEQHKKGGWHFHGLFKDIEGLELEQAINPHTMDMMVTRRGEFIYNMPQFDGIGFTTATYVKDTVSVAKYVTKYITKSLDDAMPWQKEISELKGAGTCPGP